MPNLLVELVELLLLVLHLLAKTVDMEGHHRRVEQAWLLLRRGSGLKWGGG